LEEKKTKTAVELVFLKELSLKETAKQIGTSPMTVTCFYLQKAKEQLLSNNLQTHVCQLELPYDSFLILILMQKVK